MTIRGKVAGLMVTAFAVGMLSPAVSAKTCVWTGQGTPNPDASDDLVWTDPGNWEDGNVPTDGDTVVCNLKSAAKFRVWKDLSLENLYMTNTVGATFNGDNHVLTLTGTNSIISGSTKAFNLNAKIEVPEGAKLTIDSSISVSQKLPGTFYGTGEIEKIGSGEYYFYYGNSKFAGTFYFREGTPKVYQNSGLIVNPFGGTNATAHIYCSTEFRSPISSDARLYLHSGDKLASLTTYQTVTLNGDVTFSAETAAKNPYLQGSGTNYQSADYPPGYIINGKIICDNSNFTVKPTCYAAYNASNFFVEFNGGFEGWASSLLTNKRSGSGDTGLSRVTIYLNSPFKTTDAACIYLYNTDKLVCGAKDVLNGKDVGFYSTKNIDNLDEILDLNGYDQHINRLLYSKNTGVTRLEGSIRSSRGPATLTTTKIKTDSMTVVSLDGDVSLVLNKGGAAYTAPMPFMGGTTTGWIISDWAGCDLSQAAFPNLSGIGLKGAGIAYVGATTALKEGVKLDFNGRTTGYLRVETGTDIKAAQVVDGGVDVPAGVYCRVGAGIGGATEVAWLGGDGYNGTVTVAEHAASAIWTGAANDGDLTNGDNWGSGTAPDLSDADVTVDFRYATAENPIVLNGTVNLSAAMTCGDINQGRPTFGGTGTLVLGGSGTVTNTMAFVDQASLTWNGSGTLVLKDGASTSTGTLAVESGKVVLAGDADWTGTVELDGQLELAGKSAYQVQALYLGGTLARYNKTYGSSASPAAIKDDVRFAGAGTILSLTKPGLMLIFR